MLFVVLYAAVSRVEFEVGIGSAVPTQLVLVPMLFALPIGSVARVARMTEEFGWRARFGCADSAADLSMGRTEHRGEA